MEVPTNNLMHVYPIGQEFIGKINAHCDQNDKDMTFSTIVILDRSGSMGTEAARIVRIILPQVFHKLNYPSNAQIYLITFDSCTEKIKTTVEKLHELNIYSRGNTFMEPAILELHNTLINDLPKNQRAVRLLTISDGQIANQMESLNLANRVAANIENKFQINSQAVRLFTSTCQPDTRALSSLLQLNNLVKANLLDLSANLGDDEMSSAICNLFIADHFPDKKACISRENIFKVCPWKAEYSNKISLQPGENIFWLNKIPSEPLVGNNTNIQIQIQPDVNLETYENILENKIEDYMTQLRVLKVVNSPEAEYTISSMVDYFKNLEEYIINKNSDAQQALHNPSLQFKKNISRKHKTISERMSEIANDENVSQLNFAQQADYLRTPANNLGTVQYTPKPESDFNQIVRQEVRTLSTNIEKLQNINDENHSVSFYSGKSTLRGVRELCELVNTDDSILDNMDANDILLKFNVVGIACTCSSGDTAHSKTMRVNELYLECHVSISDVLTYFIMKEGIPLKMPIAGKKITSVIPFFEDTTLAEFLKKHSPTLLEYICSIELRGTATDVRRSGDNSPIRNIYVSNLPNMPNGHVLLFKNRPPIDSKIRESQLLLSDLDTRKHEPLHDIRSTNIEWDKFKQEYESLKTNLIESLKDMKGLNQETLSFKERSKEDTKRIEALKEENISLKEVIIYNNIELKRCFGEIEVLKTYIYNISVSSLSKNEQ